MLLFTVALSRLAAAEESPFLETARPFAALHGPRLVALARATLDRVVLHGDSDPPTPPQGVPAPFGVFITLVRDGDVRGCYGTMEPSSRSVEGLVVDATLGAARQDPRNRPIAGHELGRIEIVLSFAGPTIPMLAMTEVDPKREGLLVRAGLRNSVLLPGEARTARWQLQRSLRQAGIRRGEAYEMFRFRTVTVYERGGAGVARRRTGGRAP